MVNVGSMTQWIKRFKAGAYHRAAIAAAIAITACSQLAIADEAAKAGTDAAAEKSAASEGSLVEFIDKQVRQGWTDNEIEPTAPATDEEWVRRIYLDICGRIPTLEEVKSFNALH